MKRKVLSVISFVLSVLTVISMAACTAGGNSGSAKKANVSLGKPLNEKGAFVYSLMRAQGTSDEIESAIKDLRNEIYLNFNTSAKLLRDTVTLEDYLARRSFDDEIARNSYWLDCHPSDNNTAHLNKTETADSYKKGDSHGIPFRCLVPVAMENLLVAGRCISVERKVLSSTRVMPNCLATGEAAGIAAAISVKENLTVCKIDGKRIKDIINSMQTSSEIEN